MKISSFLPSFLILFVIISACGEINSNDMFDLSEEENTDLESLSQILKGFEYQGFPDSDSCSDDAQIPEDDFSQEAEGKCRIGSELFVYRYSKINQYLDKRPNLKTLLDVDKISTCREAHRTIEVINYLDSQTSFDQPDPTVVQYEDPELIQSDQGENDGITPLIWNGSINFGSTSQNMVRINLRKLDGSNGYCSGIVINDEWIMTAAHCIMGTGRLPDGLDMFGCINCFDAYWPDPVAQRLECMTDSTPNRIACQSLASVIYYVHPDYLGSQHYSDDIGLINYTNGWNESISEARLYNGTPPIWNYAGYGYGFATWCSNTRGDNRSGSFVLTSVHTGFMNTDIGANNKWCKGDSGGMLTKYIGNNYRLVFGIHSASDKGYVCLGGGISPCAWPVDDHQLATRVDQKISWIRSTTGLTCPAYTYNGNPYVRCTY